MLRRRLRGRRTVALAAAATIAILPASQARAYPGPDAQCPNGWDTESQTCLPPPSSGPGGGRLDAECLATARFSTCQRSVFVGCQSFHFDTACRLLQLSQTDPNTFQQIMSASRACTLDSNQAACGYLERFRGLYF